MAGKVIKLYPDNGGDTARVQGIPVSVVDPTSGQILEYDLATRQYVPRDYVGKSGGTFTGNLTLNGTANTAPNQTAASGSSLMTRDLVDTRVGMHYNGVNSFLFRDYFLGGAQTSGSIGFLRWSSNSSAIAAVNGTSTERAGISIATSSVSGNGVRLCLYPAPQMTTSGSWRIEFRVKLSSVSNVKVALGYSNTATMTTSGGGILARFDSSLHTYWMLYNSGGEQASSSVPTTNWVTIVLRSPDGGATQYMSIDGGAETSLAQTRGTNAFSYMIYIETAESAAKTISLNFFEMSCA